MSRIADVLRGAVITRLQFNHRGGWVDAPVTWARPVGPELYVPVTPEKRRQALAVLAPAHPSLSWQVNGTLLACRRADEDVTVCKRQGQLTVVVDDGIPPCPKCYPTG